MPGGVKKPSDRLPKLHPVLPIQPTAPNRLLGSTTSVHLHKLDKPQLPRISEVFLPKISNQRGPLGNESQISIRFFQSAIGLQTALFGQVQIRYLDANTLSIRLSGDGTHP
jgi:hypothetical protein